jgi:hypothetical protein
MKANYAPKGGEIILCWRDGCFQAEGSGVPKARIEWADIEAIFLEVDDKWAAKDPWSNHAQTRKDGRYLPHWAAIKLGLQERLVAKYVDDWLAGGFLASQVYDTKSKARGLRVVRWIRPSSDVPSPPPNDPDSDDDTTYF